MKIRRSAGLLATITAGALLLAACSSGGSSSSSSTTAASGGTSTGIVTAWGSEPENPLIPTNTNETGGGTILTQIFAGLVYYDAKGKTHNEVADSITSSDNTNWTIKLKSGWKFTNGEPVTAKSFVDAWNYGAVSTNAQLNSGWFQDPSYGIPIVGYDDTQAADASSQPKATTMSGLKVVDDTTFTVQLTTPLSDFPVRIGYSAFFPLPSVAFKDMKAFGENPIGNGPYKVADNGWTHNVDIKLVPNPDFTGDRKARNGGLDIKFYTSQDTAYNDLLAGQLDVLQTVPSSALGTFQNDLGSNAVNIPGAVWQGFTIPQNLAHFTGAEGQLRRAALSHAIDRDTITKTIFHGTRTPATDFTSPVIPGWSDKIDGSDVLKYDPAAAKKLWAQADAMSPWSGTFTIAYNADGGHQAWVDAVTNSIKNALGIDAAGQPYPVFKDLRTDINASKKGKKTGLTGAFRSGWQGDYPGALDFLGAMWATGAGSNDGSYSNPQFDALLSKGAQEKSLDDANKDFAQAQTILFKDLPSIPLWYSNSTGGFAKTVKNVEFGWDGVPLYYAVTKS